MDGWIDIYLEKEGQNEKKKSDINGGVDVIVVVDAWMWNK